MSTQRMQFSSSRWASMLLALLCGGSAVQAFIPLSPVRKLSIDEDALKTFFGCRRCSKEQTKLDYSPFDDFPKSEEESSNSAAWLDGLKERAARVNADEEDRLNRWKNATCSSGVASILPDWVRRLDVDYPLAVCGSSKGALYVIHLETGEVVSTNLQAEDEAKEETKRPPKNLESTLRHQFGSFDGGGTLAVAFSGSLICSADRDGGVKVWSFDAVSKRIEPQGKILALQDELVVSLHLEDSNLWVGTASGQVQSYPLDDDLPLVLRSRPEMSWDLNAPLVSMHIGVDIGCALTTTAHGTVKLISLEDDSGKPVASFSPPFDSMERRATNVFAQSCTFVAHTAMDSSSVRYSAVCGGNDGSLYIQPIATNEFGEVDLEKPFREQIKSFASRHLAPVKCLSSPRPGIFVSGGQDSSLRIWDADEITFLYQFVGYKVWLGSIWTDGRRIVTDGADNTVVMHDFDKAEE